MVVVPRRLDVAMRLSNSKEPWTGGGCVGAHGVSRPRAQSLHFGTAPGPTHDCEAFDTVRSSAHDGLLACWEWCAEWGDDIDDEALWSPVNPAVATGRVPMQAVLDNRAVQPRLSSRPATRCPRFTGVLIAGSTRNLPQRCWQWRHPARARA